MMTWGELKLEMEKAGVLDSTPLVMASDAEGNKHRPVAEIEGGLYVPESNWQGRFYGGKDQEEVMNNDRARFVVCIWPVG